MEKYGVIDIGSNSIRLMMSKGLETLYKVIKTTQLAQELQKTKKLREDAMNRSVDAVNEFYKRALKEGADKVYVFATEAVRSAENKEVFINKLKDLNINIDVIESQNEAKLGFYGAYKEGTVCVMDIGGASTEMAVGDKDGIIYSKSIPIGIVRIKDNCGEDLTCIEKFIEDKLKEYGRIPQFDQILAIGGTASSFAAINMQMEEYDTKMVDFYKLYKEDVIKMVKNIHSVPFDERGSIKGLSLKRRDVIVGGGILLVKIMDFLNKDYVIVRENDNQEGYLKYKLGLLDI